MDGPWLPAMLDAIARCGRTEFLRPIERFVKKANRATVPIGLIESAERALAQLQRRQQHDREAATLLRSPALSEDALLRPAESISSAQPEILLRSSGCIVEEDGQYADSAEEQSDQVATVRQR